MIFKTIDDENSSSGKKIITSFSALSKKNKIDLSKIFDDEFDKKLQTDIASLNAFKDAVKKNMPPLEALQDKMFNASSAAIEFAKTHEAASLNVDEFKVKQKQAQLTLAASNTSFASVRGIIDDYNNECATSKLKTEEFISAVSESNKTLGNYLNTVEAGSAKMSGYIKSLSAAKLKGVGAQLGSIAANMIVSFGLSWGINSIITLFNDWVNAATNASEASKEAAKSALDIAEKHDEEKQSLSDLINQYKELAASGTVEPASKEKARDIQKEINSLVGEQVNGLDLVNGRLDEQLQKLKEAAQIQLGKDHRDYIAAASAAEMANQDAFIKINNSTNSWDATGLGNPLHAWESIANGSELLTDNDAVGQGILNGIEGISTFKIDYLNSLGVKFNADSAEERYDLITKAIEALETQQSYDYTDSSLYNGLVELRSQYKTDFIDPLNEAVDALLSDTINFEKGNLDNNGEAINSLESYKKYRQDLIDAVYNSNDLSNFVNDGKIDYNSVVDNVDQLMSQYYKKYYDEWVEESQGGLFYIEGLEELVGKLSDEDMHLLYNISVSGVDTATWELKDWQAALEEARAANKDSHFDDLLDEDFLAKIDTYKEKVSKLDTALSNYRKNGFDSEEFYSLIKDFPELANNADDLDSAIVSLAEDLNEHMFSDFESQFGNIDDLSSDDVAALKAFQNAVLELGEKVANTEFSIDIETETENLDNVYEAIKQSTSATGLNDEAIAQLTLRYKKLKDFDAEVLFEKTANGIHLNVTALRQLESEYVKQNKQKNDEKLKDLQDQYSKLTKEIYECSDASERAELYAKRNEIVTQIDEVSMCAAQYEGLTSAYNNWILAQSAGEEGDMYESIRSSLENMQELYDQGLVGKNVFRDYVDLLSSKDLSSASATEVREEFERLGETIEGTSYTAMSFLEEDANGVLNFLNAVQQINPEWAKLENGKWGINFRDDEEVAQKLGIDIEFLQTMLRKLTEYEWVINLKTKYSDLTPLTNEELTLENINDAISQTQNKLNYFKNSDGSVNLDIKGAEEAQKELENLLFLKQSLINEKVNLLNVDTSFEDVYTNYYIHGINIEKEATYRNELRTAISLLQSFYKSNEEIKIGINTDEAKRKIDEILSRFKDNESLKDCAVALGVDISSADSLTDSINRIISDPNFEQKINDLGLTMNAEVDDSEVEDFKDEDNDTSSTVKYTPDFSNVVNSTVPSLYGKVFYDAVVGKTNTYYIHGKEYTYEDGFNRLFNPTNLSTVSPLMAASGFANADGTAGKNLSGLSLGGELGQELVVRNGKYFTIGEKSAEFFKYKKNDIIFNAEQTKQLLETGGITKGKKRGTAYVEGNAYSNGSGSITVNGNVKTNGSENSSNDNSSSSSNSSDSDKKDFEETFDWIEIAINRVERAISNLSNKVKSVYKSWSSRNHNIFSEMAEIRGEINLQNKAYNRYMKEANSVGLSSNWQKVVQNGSIDISTIKNEDLAEKIKEYQDWYEKALQCKDSIDELNESLSELAENNFDNITSQWDEILNKIENKKSVIEESMSQSEAQGYMTSTKYYNALISNERNNISDLNDKYTKQIVALNDAVALGKIKKDSQAYNDMENQIRETKMAIIESQTAMLEYNKSIREANWDVFDMIQDKISNITKESEFLIDLLDNDILYDDKGQLTAEGTATMGLHGMNYNVYMEQASKYADEIKKLDKEIANDPSNQDLINRKEELLDLQRESISSAEDEKDAIRDMVEEGINKELEALKNLIDTYSDALDSQKDLYDYQKKIADQTDEITSLEKQLSAYSNDLSEESKSKIQKIKVSLEEAKENLEETQYDKYVSDQKKLLDDLYNEYEEILNQRLDNIEALVSDMIDYSNENAKIINQTIQNEAKEVGYTISDSIADVWKNSENSSLTTYVNGIGVTVTNVDNSLNEIKNNMMNMVKEINDNANRQMGILPNYGFFEQGGNLSHKGDKSYDIENNLIERMRFYGIDSTKADYYFARAGLSQKYGAWEGFSNKTQTKALLEWMKANGYASGIKNVPKNELAWTQEKGAEAIIRPSDGAILTPLVKNDSVLNADATSNLYDFMNDPNGFIQDKLDYRDIYHKDYILDSLPQLSGLVDISKYVSKFTKMSNGISNSIDMGGFTINIPIERVIDYNDFVSQLQKDKQFEKLIQSVTVDLLSSKNSTLAKNKYTW